MSEKHAWKSAGYNKNKYGRVLGDCVLFAGASLEPGASPMLECLSMRFMYSVFYPGILLPIVPAYLVTLLQ